MPPVPNAINPSPIEEIILRFKKKREDSVHNIFSRKKLPHLFYWTNYKTLSTSREFYLIQ